MKKQSKKLWLTIEKTIKKKVIDNWKKNIDNQKQKTKTSQLWKIVLYENQSIENQLTSEFEKQVFENQKNDLKKIDNWKSITLIDYWLEKIFFDVFLKNQLVNTKILKKDIEKQVFILSKSFINQFDLIDNSQYNQKDYEKRLIEKLTNKFILDYIKKNWNKIDKKDFHIVKNLTNHIEKIKNQYKITGFEKLDFYNWLLKNLKNQSNIKISKKSKKDIKKDINLSIVNYHKLYEKYLQKKLKSSKRLSKKYWFLIDCE